MTGTINAAIIGCGGIHHVHAGVINQLEGVRLAAVCDNKPERAQASANANGCLCYTDYQELLKKRPLNVQSRFGAEAMGLVSGRDIVAAGKEVDSIVLAANSPTGAAPG